MTMTRSIRRLLLPLLLVPTALVPALAADTAAHGAGHGTGQGAAHGAGAARSPYAGEESRDIKSLSADDVAELRRGGGWGLARAAELNGMPGPVHLLELSDELGLGKDQVNEIRELYDAMKAEAVPAGERLIEAEAALERFFRDGRTDEAALREAVDAAGRARAELRRVHLAAHLATPALLSDAQRSRYDELRGYSNEADPCANVPPGHDATMWREHNGCS